MMSCVECYIWCVTGGCLYMKSESSLGISNVILYVSADCLTTVLSNPSQKKRSRPDSRILNDGFTCWRPRLFDKDLTIHSLQGEMTALNKENVELSEEMESIDMNRRLSLILTCDDFGHRTQDEDIELLKCTCVSYKQDVFRLQSVFCCTVSAVLLRRLFWVLRLTFV